MMRCNTEQLVTRLALYTVVCAVISGCGGDDKPSKKNVDAGFDGGRQDSGVEACTSDTVCSDGLFCNGAERCNRGAKGADERGCINGESGPCSEGKSCDESADKCVSCTDNADLDGDNHKSVTCGGDDCDDNDPKRYPGNVEVCDEKNRDEDCDSATFGDKDTDGDGEVNATCCNEATDGKKVCGTDCDDSQIDRRSGQLEICDGRDNDCDGQIDEEENVVNWYQDSDGDGFGDATVVDKSCKLIPGASLLSTDCNAQDSSIHPGASEPCDHIDNDCDSQTDELTECSDRAGGAGGSGTRSTAGSSASAPVGGTGDSGGSGGSGGETGGSGGNAGASGTGGVGGNGCSPTNQGGRCDDGWFCNGIDTCDTAGNCSIHAGNPCAQGNQCNNQCNESADNCYLPNTTLCENDSNPATVDHCDGAGSCVTGPDYCATNACWKIPPTGQTTCYNDSAAIICPVAAGSDSCTTTSFCGQDAQYTDNSRTFSESTGGSGTTFTDSLTGLIWPSVISDQNYLWPDAVNYCDTLNYADQSDWRLPDINELGSLLSYGTFSPASAHLGIPAWGAWTSTPLAGAPTQAWVVAGSTGVFNPGPKTGGYPGPAICVRGASYITDSRPTRFYVIGSAEEAIVLDRSTTLIWQAVGNPSTTNWQDALAYCEGLSVGGFQDWRLPNVNELRSLVNYTKTNPASDFPAIQNQTFWSSSTCADTLQFAWIVEFSLGLVSCADRGGTASYKTRSDLNVRCVRGGT